MKSLHSKFKVPLFLRKEDGDLLKIENSLVKTMSELRNKELSSIMLSEEFSLRLKNQLQQIEPEPESGWERIRENVLSNRGLQLSFSAILALAIVFVSYNRFQSPSSPSLTERSGTVFDSKDSGSFKDIPSSGSFSSSIDEALLKQIPASSEAKKTLDSLQRYFSEKGDLRTVEELGKIIEKTQGK
ncbi:hypothetical protein JWG45_07720 [Leptospira sp. 201903070]|uniref:Anti-sigma factor n=1 Tax=Leptospira ainlahdjerensis TaxID=2810033 RepID=A0ABS2U9J8_9LEPT|nr:hypothetical protein [Leptospira ainlahdjerensis]MBM9577041.1 hypothetical protein [Leptospira ainlahdjerensis]